MILKLQEGIFLDNDIITKDGIEKHLSSPYPIEILENVDSTNRYLKKISCGDTVEGYTVIAIKQTNGHGRFNRKFHSPENSGIYMSILLKPTITADTAVLVTSAAAVAVCEAIEICCHTKAQIKWVNDIIVNSKKVCGILAEGKINPETQKFESIIIGIGLNVYSPTNGFAEEIKDVAGAVAHKETKGLKNKLIAEIINRLVSYSHQLSKKTFLKNYKRRNIVIGKTVTIIKGDVKKTAKAIDIDDSCRLLVEFQDKTKTLLDSGEISLRL